MRIVLRGEHPFLHPFRSITKSLFFFNSPKCSAKTLPIVSSKKTQGFLRCIAMASTTTTTTAPVVHQVKERIELTEIERKIFDRLLATNRHFGLTNQLRVAGGWVRDKLLGKDCYDIDIALDNMLGSEFVDKVRDYLLSTGEQVQGVAVIPCNPEQSKHLETARMRLFDMWIDFVNLRSEEYSDNSRIPTKQKFGTAEEDAYRRDLTINSLFYNINTDSVEDFTRRGIADLKSGKIVTPLPAKATFLDDPLRVLRAIRFGARFGFLLDEELKKAASCDEVKDALAAKISRERIGVEIDLMISGNQPVKAMTYICDLTLFSIVFSLPPNFEPAKTENCDSFIKAHLVAREVPVLKVEDHSNNILSCTLDVEDHADSSAQAIIATLYVINISSIILLLLWTMSQPLFPPRLCITYLDATWNLIQLIGDSTFNDEQRRLSLYAALFLPLRKTIYKDNKAKKIPVVNYIFRESLKRKASDAETVVNLHSALEKFLSLIPFLESDGDIELIEVDWGKGLDDVPLNSKLRVLTGLLLREIKDFWRVALLLSTLLYPPDVNCTENFPKQYFQLDKQRDLFKAVESAITKLGLEKVWDVKPLVNGKDIMSVLQLKAGGPLIREWQQKLLAWQLAHPDGTMEESMDWMRQAHSKRVKTQ